MRNVKLVRTETGIEGTFGILTTDSMHQWYSGELPWRDNQPNKSCIPEGVYSVLWLPSEKFGECYHIQKVPNRTGIEIHSANFMGDMDRGLACDLEGCVALSEGLLQFIGTQKQLYHSHAGIIAFQCEMNHEPFELTIVSAFQGLDPMSHKVLSTPTPVPE